MKRNKALGVALVTAPSASLLVGCTSGNADTSTPTTPRATTPASDPTPSAYPLVGTNWRAGEGPGRRCDGDGDLPNNGFGRGLFLMADGTWNIPWCQSYGGTYEVNGDTITWLGGSDCDAGVKGTYKFTLNNGQFTQVVVDDPCGPRRDAFDGVAYYAPERTLGPSAS